MEILEELTRELKSANAAIERKIDAMKTANAEGREELKTQIAGLQSQADALDKKMAESFRGGGLDRKTVEQVVKENDDAQRFFRNNSKGTFHLEIPNTAVEWKTTIDSAALGSSTSGVLQIDRTPGIVAEARQALRLRNVLSSRPTSLGQVDYVKVNSAPSIASLQVEGSPKLENAVTFTTGVAPVKTIATWIPMTRQAMDDQSELIGYINVALPYYVNKREEIEFLFGGGGSTDINGLYTQATALQTALALPAYNKSDLIAAAIQQIEIATEVEPTFVVLHPTDYWQILRTKDANRNYIFGNQANKADPFWGLTPIRSTHMGAGDFLVGSGSPEAVEIRDRMTTTLTISTEHSDFFTSNKIAVLAEKRVALPVYRAASFVKGSFSTSP